MIDENKLVEEIESMMASVPVIYIKDKNHDRLDAYLDALGRVKTQVRYQPKVGEWIPCNERLPEEKSFMKKTCVLQHV